HPLFNRKIVTHLFRLLSVSRVSKMPPFHIVRNKSLRFHQGFKPISVGMLSRRYPRIVGIRDRIKKIKGPTHIDWLPLALGISLGNGHIQGIAATMAGFGSNIAA